MVKIRIPGTSAIRFVSDHSGDFVVDMTDVKEADSTIQNEDTVVIGDWSDYSGSGTRPSQEVMRAGLANSFEGNLLTDKRFGDLTPRGNRAATTRARPKLITIEVNAKEAVD